MTKRIPVTLVALLLSCSVSRGLAASAETIFRSASPGVVLIRDMEGHGSGVVLSRKGTILTCYHVVNTPLPLEITAEVSRYGRRQTMTFKEVKVLGVHKEYDLAMVSVELPPGVSLKELPRSTRTPATGEECFVIGNPGGAEGKALRNSISTGIISASERVVEQQKYIQTTAAINPGNSGGALVDKYGRLIGIISFIISDTQGIGFAIPVKELKTGSFVKEKDRKGDINKAIEYERIGNEWYTRAKRCTGKLREFALAMAYIAYRQSLGEYSSDPAPYNNLGNIYVDQGEHEKGKWFFAKAVELGEGNPLYLKMLGICEEKCGNSEKAKELWRKGVLCKKEDQIRSECAENLAIMAVEKKSYAEAAYLVRWANCLAKARHSRVTVRNNVYQEAVADLTDKQFEYIARKTEGFSFEDMEKFKAGRLRAAAAKKTPSRTASESSKAPANIKKVFDRALKDAPVPGPDGLKKRIPESAADCIPAYGGIYWVMKFKEMKKLGVFNIAQVKFEEYIPISNPNCIYAAGGNTLVVFDPNQKIFQLYDLRTLKRAASKMSRIQGELTDLSMGLLTSDRAIASWAVGTGALDRRQYGLLEIPSMRLTPFRTEGRAHAQGFRNRSYRDNVHIRVDPGFKRFVSWCTSHSPSGFIYGTINGTTISSHYEHSSFGSLSLLNDRSRIVASAGKLLNLEGGIRHDFKTRGSVLFAVDGADLVINVNGTKASLVDAINLTELATFTLPFTIKASHWNKDNFTTDRQVYASAYLNRAIFLDNGGQQVVVFKLSGGSKAAVLAEQLTGVAPGTLWTRKLEYPAGTRVVVEDAPDGVKFDAKAMSLKWQIPRTAKRGSHQILLSVTEPGKDEVYRRVAVTVR